MYIQRSLLRILRTDTRLHFDSATVNRSAEAYSCAQRGHLHDKYLYSYINARYEQWKASVYHRRDRNLMINQDSYIIKKAHRHIIRYSIACTINFDKRKKKILRHPITCTQSVLI